MNKTYSSENEIAQSTPSITTDKKNITFDDTMVSKASPTESFLVQSSNLDSSSSISVSTGFEIPKPPNRVGNAMRRRSTGDTSLPMMAGIKIFLIASSRGSKRVDMSQIVLRMYVHLLHNPLVNAE